jgi:hypothetical protein
LPPEIPAGRHSWPPSERNREYSENQQAANPANMIEETLRDIKAKEKIERAFPTLRIELEKPKE